MASADVPQQSTLFKYYILSLVYNTEFRFKLYICFMTNKLINLISGAKCAKHRGLAMLQLAKSNNSIEFEKCLKHWDKHVFHASQAINYRKINQLTNINI